MSLLRLALVVAAFGGLCQHASAQVDRYELGLRLRAFERQLDATPDAARRRAAYGELDRAVQAFFRLDLKTVAKAIAAADEALVGAAPADRRFATSLRVELPARLVDPRGGPVALRLAAAYRADEDLPADLVRARDAQRVPKILVGGLSAVLEAWLDREAIAAGVVSTWVITWKPSVGSDGERGEGKTRTDRLAALTVILNSATCSRTFMRLHGAGAMSGNQTTIKKRAIATLKIPDLGDGSELADLHTRLSSDARDARLEGFAHGRVARLYGRSLQDAVDDLAWWWNRSGSREPEVFRTMQGGLEEAYRP